MGATPGPGVTLQGLHVEDYNRQRRSLNHTSGLIWLNTAHLDKARKSILCRVGHFKTRNGRSKKSSAGAGDRAGQPTRTAEPVFGSRKNVRSPTSSARKNCFVLYQHSSQKWPGQGTDTGLGCLGLHFCSMNVTVVRLPVLEVRGTGTGKKMFFQIEQTGPPDDGPARSDMMQQNALFLQSPHSCLAFPSPLHSFPQTLFSSVLYSEMFATPRTQSRRSHGSSTSPPIPASRPPFQTHTVPISPLGLVAGGPGGGQGCPAPASHRLLKPSHILHDAVLLVAAFSRRA